MPGRSSEKDLLRLGGSTLHGEHWHTPLARDLGLSDTRRIRQWVSGSRPIPAGVMTDIQALLQRRSDDLLSLLAEFSRAANTTGSGGDLCQHQDNRRPIQEWP